MTTPNDTTLADILLQLAADETARPDMLTYLRGNQELETVSGVELLARAQCAAAALRANGVMAGDRVLLMLLSQADFVDTFLGAIWAGAVPVPLFPPIFAKQPGDFIANFSKIAASSGARLMVASDKIIPMTQGFAEQLGSGFRILPRSSWNNSGERLEESPASGPDDLALLQFTSGSTGVPKGVALSHANIVANVHAIGRAVELNADDVGVSWLPLYHDMGLIGVLATLYWGGRVILLSPLHFAKDPALWLRVISEHRGTLSPAPNFAYHRCLRLTDEELAGLNLSSWRVAFNGSEPVRPDTVHDFNTRFAAYGFQPSAFYPVYGLAEHTLAVSFPSLGQGAHVDTVDRGKLAAEGVAETVPATDTDTMSLVSVGTPLEGVTVEIRDEQDALLPEGFVGEVLVRSASVMAGYFGNAAATAEVMSGDWLRTGDLGYLKDGMLFITGRIKDVIIRAGRNYYPDDIESAATSVSGVQGGRAAAFTVPATDGEEHVVVLAESDLSGQQLADVSQAIASAVARRVGFQPEHVELRARGTLPVTSSGKVQRRLARARFLSGALQNP